MRLSLRNKFILVNILIVLFVAIGILIIIRNTLSKSLQEELQKRGEFIANHLADMVVDDLLTEDILNLKLNVSDYKKSDSDIIYIFIEDVYGGIVAHTFMQGFPTELEQVRLPNKNIGSRVKRFLSEVGVIYDISAPIYSGKLGFVHIGLSEKTIKNTLNSITHMVFLVISIIFLLSILVFGYFSTLITRPLEKLKIASGELAKGNFHYRIETESHDEIGLLGKTFNYMAENIDQMYKKLKESYNKLENEIQVRKAIEIELDRSIRFLNNIYDSIVDPFVIIDRNFNIVRVNNAYASLKDRSVEDLLHKTCFRELIGRDSVCEGCVIEKTIRSGNPSSKEKKVILSDGSEVWLELYTYPIYDKDNVITHVIEYTIDITDKKRIEEQRRLMIKELEKLSRTDSLTGLLNRRAVLELLEYNLKRTSRYKARTSVIITDIDNFKDINDSYGHPAGDEVIKGVAKTIKDALREPDIVGRYGGDEFLLILPETDLSGAMELAERIRRIVESANFVIGDNIYIKTTISLGVINCTNLTGVEEVIKLGDKALYTSKKEGRNRSYTIT